MVHTITYLQSYLVHYFVHSGSQKCSSQTDPKRFKSLCTARLLLNVAKTYCMVLKNAKSSRLTLWCFCTPDQDAWLFFVCTLLYVCFGLKRTAKIQELCSVFTRAQTNILDHVMS